MPFIVGTIITIISTVAKAAYWFSTLSAFAQFGFQLVLGLVLSTLAAKLSKRSPSGNSNFSVSGNLQRGSDKSQSFIFGTYATAGHLVWAEEWGWDGVAGSHGGLISKVLEKLFVEIDYQGIPNGFLTQVIEVSSLPVRGLNGMVLEGEAVTISDTNEHATFGKRITNNASMTKNYDGYAWVKFYDGTQTEADPFISTGFIGENYGLDSNFIGLGNAYAIVTFKAKKEGLWTGFPRSLFIIDGIPLLKSSTGGANTVHNNPIDAVYTLLLGLADPVIADDWFFGGQKITAAQLPVANWGAQADKCATAGYTCAGEIRVSDNVLDVISEILACCGGKLAESAGQFIILAAEPDASVATFTDDEIISTNEETFTPFIGLDDAINGISAVYPSPVDNWQNQTAAPIYRPDLEIEDDNRRLVSDIQLPFVTDDVQAQRLMKAALLEARRARKHTLALPSNYWQVEPLDVISWTSAKNGYTGKKFLVDGVVDAPNGDELFDLTEIDMDDFAWTKSVDFTPLNRSPLVSPLPVSQAVSGWSVEAEFLLDANGRATTIGIRMNWSAASVSGVDHMTYQIRQRGGAETVIVDGINLDLESGSRLITKDFQLDTEYEVRAKYIPDTDRRTSWTAWTLVAAQASEEPNVLISDFLKFQGETLITSLLIKVGSESLYYKRAQIRWRLDDPAAEFSVASDGPLGDFTVPIVEDGLRYVVEVTLIGADQKLAAPVVFYHLVIGKTALPGIVSDLSVNAHGQTATLSWKAPPDLDLSHYIIKHSDVLTEAVYSDAIPIILKVPRPAVTVTVPALKGTFFVRTVDKTGNKSATAPAIVLTDGESIVRSHNSVHTITEHPNFSGTKTGVSVVTTNQVKGLEISAAHLLFDGIEGDFDDQIGDFDDIGTKSKNLFSGQYEFGQTDLGAKYYSRVTPIVKISQNNLDTSNFFDSGEGLFDEGGLFDGEPTVFDDSINFEIQASITDDDPAAATAVWSDFQKLVASNMRFRGIRFKAFLKTSFDQHVPRVTNLSIEIDMPDRLLSGAGSIPRKVAGNTGLTAVVFDPPFYAVPVIGTTIADSPAGFRTVITSLTKTGFSVALKNSTDAFYAAAAPAAIGFTWTAKGYGET